MALKSSATLQQPSIFTCFIAFVFSGNKLGFFQQICCRWKIHYLEIVTTQRQHEMVVDGDGDRLLKRRNKQIANEINIKRMRYIWMKSENGKPNFIHTIYTHINSFEH